MSEKEIKENKKFGWKKKVIIIFTIFIVSGCLYYSGKAFLHYSWKTSLRYKNNVACFVGGDACFYLGITKEKFIQRMERLELSKKEVFQKATLAKKKWEQICLEHKKMDCSQIFEYFDKVFKYLDEIPD